jgi:hypothetical protein
MKISRGFVKGLLIGLVVFIILNIVMLVIGQFKSWMAYVAAGLFVVLFFLIFRKHKVWFIKFLAWVLPIIFILIVLYLNFLPFGFHQEYTMSINDDGSINSSSPAFYLQDMKGKKITNFTDVYNYSVVTAVLKPKIVLRGAQVNASIVGDNAYFAKTNFSVENNSWNYFWNFSKGVSSDLKGTAKYNAEKGCVYFNGSNNETLYYPNSSDMFENDSFIVYVKWKPEDPKGQAQQIIGHYNWELWQNNDSVKFMIGRLDNKNGSMPSISFPVNESFFNVTHEVLAIYRTDNKTGFGYIELFVDNISAGRKVITNSTIWGDYNGEKNLSSGWSSHNYGKNSYFTGCVYSAGFDYGKMRYVQGVEFNVSEKLVHILIIGSGKFNSTKLSIEK